MWRVYYEDGSTWDHAQGMEGMPCFGVMCILQCVDRYHIVYGCKYYMHAEGEWLHAYENDIVDYLVNDKPITKLLVGRMTSKKIFSEVYAAAKHDKDLENL
jgi:hypothetical protein